MGRKSMIKNGLSIMIILMCSYGTVIPVIATENTVKAAAKEEKAVVTNTSILGSLVLKPNVTAEVRNLLLMPSGNGQMASFVVEFHNNSDQDLNFINYWANLITTKGNKYSVKLVDDTIDKIPSASSVDAQFYAEIGKNVKLNELKVEMIKWDFSAANYQDILGTVAVPSNYRTFEPIGGTRTITSSESSLDIAVKRTVISNSQDYYRPDITIHMVNSGRKSITLPGYQLTVLTPEGLMYPLQTVDFGNITLAPLMDKEFQISATIPHEVKKDQWKLVIALPITDKKLPIPIAEFDLQMSNDSQSTSELGKEYSFSDANGVYYIKLNSINRVPQEDQDIISANLTVTNKGASTLPVPDFAGQFKFDDSIKRDADVFIPDKMVAIEPGQSVDIGEMCVIPYTYNPSKVTLNVQEKGNQNSDTTDLVSFASAGSFDPIPNVAAESIYPITDLGHRSDLQVRKTLTFKGDNANIVAAQVMVTNNEKRYSDIERLAGYFQSSDGSVYPTEIKDLSDKVMPGGNVILYAIAKVPATAKTSDMSLVLGKAIETVSTGSDGTPTNSVTGYVDPVNFSLPKELAAKNDLNDIENYPFTLSIKNIGTSMNYESQEMTLMFDYNLKKDLLGKTNLTQNDVVIEISDDANNYTFSKTITLDKDDGDAGLIKGNHSFKYSWTNDKTIYDISLLKQFKLNVYQEIQSGQRKLLASQSFDWFVRN